MTAFSIDRPPITELLTVDAAVTPPSARLTAVGEIDSSSAGGLRERLDGVLADRSIQEIVIDLVAVTFLDSAGLCVLAGAHRIATEQGRTVRVLAASRAVVRPLQITGLWALLQAEQVEAPAGPRA